MPSWPRRRTTLLTGALALGLVVWSAWPSGSVPAVTPVSGSVKLVGPTPAPQDYQPTGWTHFNRPLAWTRSLLATVNTLPTDVPDADVARLVAIGALRAQLSLDPITRQPYAAYLADPFVKTIDDPADSYAGRCRDIDIAGAAPVALPWDTEVIKVLVVWSGDCVDGLTTEVLGGASRDPNLYQRSVIYLQRDSAGLHPVRVTTLSGSASGHQPAAAALVPRMLTPVRCGKQGPHLRARLELVEALAGLCTAAARDGVHLEVTSALRTDTEQRDLGPGRASAEVIWRGNRCASRHCAGFAVDVRGAKVASWLSRTVACEALTSGVISASGGPCPQGSQPVRQSLIFGFAQPYTQDPGHLEYVLPPATQSWRASCSPDPALAIPEIIVSVWHCRLGQAGLSKELVLEASARALVVSRCTSGWNSELRVGTDGTPVIGVFQLPSREVRQRTHLPPTDPAANADAAVQRFLISARAGVDGFGSWPCAAGLPDTGGRMPAWAYAWS